MAYPHPSMERIFVYGFPGLYGGAGTELHHQIIAWQHLGLKVHLIPTNEGFPREPLFEEMIRRGVKVHLPHDFRVLEPEDAILGFCNAEFLAKLPEIIQRTRRTVFLNCMTWLFDKEKECMARGEIGMFLYQNENVRQKHMPELRALNPDAEARFLTFRPYFENSLFPYVEERSQEHFGCGRISRQDADKFAANTLHIYEYFVSPKWKRGLFLGFDQRSEAKVGTPFDWIKTAADQTEVSQAEFYQHCEIILQPSDTTDSWQVAEEYVGTSSTPQRRYYWGMREINDLIRRQRYSSGTTLQDDLYALGDRMNVVAVVDASGAVQQRMGYSAFGTPIWLTSAWAASTNTKEWNVLFHGHFLDGESRLYQMRFRYFQTGLGRWTSRDPIGETGGFNLYQAFSNDPASQKDVFGLELNFPEPEFPKSTAKPLPDGRRWLGITNCSISLQISCEPCEESGCAKIKHSLTMNVTTTIPTLVDPMRRDGKVGPAIPLSQNILNLLRAHEDKHRQDCKNFHDYWSNALEANANASACAMDKATCEEVVKTLKNAFDIARAQLDARRDHAGGDDHWAEMKAIEDALQKERWSQFNGGK